MYLNKLKTKIKDLVQVLGRQDGLFKRKFFDCLMSKLWDTTLPYEEYYQLNKLMTALFGENYHKIERSSPHPAAAAGPQHSAVNNSQNMNQQQQQQQPRVNRLDAEHVVNLVRAYLDQNKVDDTSISIYAPASALGVMTTPPSLPQQLPVVSSQQHQHPPHSLTPPPIHTNSVPMNGANFQQNGLGGVGVGVSGGKTQPAQQPSTSIDTYSSVSNLIMTLKRRKRQSDGPPNIMTLFQNNNNNNINNNNNNNCNINNNTSNNYNNSRPNAELIDEEKKVNIFTFIYIKQFNEISRCFDLLDF